MFSISFYNSREILLGYKHISFFEYIKQKHFFGCDSITIHRHIRSEEPALIIIPSITNQEYSFYDKISLVCTFETISR